MRLGKRARGWETTCASTVLEKQREEPSHSNSMVRSLGILSEQNGNPESALILVHTIPLDLYLTLIMSDILCPSSSGRPFQKDLESVDSYDKME
jgi:hypothetical protein